VGIHTLAVSDDLKAYLMDNYKIREEKITVTVNGINTEDFCAGTNGGDLLSEFSLPPGKRYIVTVSRLDKNACESTYRLLSCAEKLKASFPDTKILVVGRGDAWRYPQPRETINESSKSLT
jgi:glycosyltransferase involved in cell wall biosynthesis